MAHHHFSQPPKLSILTYSCSEDCGLEQKVVLLNQIVETPFVHCIIQNAWSNFPQINDANSETQQVINQLLDNKYVKIRDKSSDVFLIDKHLCPKTHVSSFSFKNIGDDGGELKKIGNSAVRIFLKHGHHSERKISETVAEISRTPPSHLYLYTMNKKNQLHNVFHDLDGLLKYFFGQPYIIMADFKGETIEEIAFQLSARDISFISRDSSSSASTESTKSTLSNLFLLYSPRFFRFENDQHHNVVTLTIRGHDVDDEAKQEELASKLRNKTFTKTSRLNNNLPIELNHKERMTDNTTKQMTATDKTTEKTTDKTTEKTTEQDQIAQKMGTRLQFRSRPPPLSIPKGGFPPIPISERPPSAPRASKSFSLPNVA